MLVLVCCVLLEKENGKSVFMRPESRFLRTLGCWLPGMQCCEHFVSQFRAHGSDQSHAMTPGAYPGAFCVLCEHHIPLDSDTPWSFSSFPPLWELSAPQLAGITSISSAFGHCVTADAMQGYF